MSNPNPSPSSPLPRVRVSEMEIPHPSAEEAAPLWEWGSLLDFNIDVDDDPLILSWGGDSEISRIPSPPPPLPPATAAEKSPSRVRKRDPRLVCENYLAGLVPCSCPEVDEKELEEDEKEAEVVAGGRNKRARAGGSSAAARCQVPGCEADIRELKGYHRRHRVCLRCANASSVVLDGEPKRYCQQCGKFHVLPDFDEGKRSCRRKLERHNKRRRRRPTDFRNVVEKEKEPQRDLLTDVNYDGEPREELLNGFACETVVSNKVINGELQLESEDGHGSPVCSLPSFQNVQSNSVVSFAASAEAHIDERVDNSKSALSSTFCDNRNAYSSVCPTGRISFKLYDWNPAEFPRRLRHQIFQWLASMPVELEGYIRPGCTILTIFIAMPQFMWEKLSQEAALNVRDLVNAPESLFLGRGNIFIYLSNMIIQVMKDGTSLMNIKMEVKAPRLHYVHPTYFEAGKPVEFVACGSNLDQPKFRFLVSFAGKYLVYDSCCAISHGKIKPYEGNGGDSFEHELFRIRISQTDSKLLGPAFVEVENESGISNFIPVLFGNKHICSELERMQGTFSESLCTDSFMSQIAVSGASVGLCELFVSKQTAVSELLVDISWLLKEPRVDKSETVLSSINIHRLTCLLKFSIQNEYVSVLEVILHYLDTVIGGAGFHKSENVTSHADLKLLLEYVNSAREVLNQRAVLDMRSELDTGSLSHRVFMPQSNVKSSTIFTMPSTNQGEAARNGDGLCSTTTSFQENGEVVPLISKAIIHRKHCYPQLHVNWPQEHCFRRKVTRARLAVLIMVSVVMCFGACIVLLHPHSAREFAVSIRRCLYGDPLP